MEFIDKNLVALTFEEEVATGYISPHPIGEFVLSEMMRPRAEKMERLRDDLALIQEHFSEKNASLSEQYAVFERKKNMGYAEAELKLMPEDSLLRLDASINRRILAGFMAKEVPEFVETSSSKSKRLGSLEFQNVTRR